MTRQGLGLLGVPTSAGAHAAGQEKAPQHLRRMGLVDRLPGVSDFGDLPLAVYRPGSADRRAQNLDRVVAVARGVADGVDAIVAKGLLPVVLGGDCTITLGVLAGLGRHDGVLGLLYLDGDVDLTTPATTSSGILDSMGLAHALGDGAPELAGLGPRRPLVDPGRVVAFGYSPAGGGARGAGGARPPRRGLPPGRRGRRRRRRAGAGAANGPHPRALRRRRDRLRGVPARRLPAPHLGLSFAEATDALAAFCASPAFAGLVLTEVNPDHDPDGSLTLRLIDTLAGALTATPVPAP